MQFVDKEFARRTESAEEIPQVRYAQLYQKLHPEIGAAYEEICGGHMVFAGVGSPIGRAIALASTAKFPLQILTASKSSTAREAQPPKSTCLH